MFDCFVMYCAHTREDILIVMVDPKILLIVSSTWSFICVQYIPPPALRSV